MINIEIGNTLARNSDVEDLMLECCLVWGAELGSVRSTGMTERKVPSSVAQRIIIKFLNNEGVKPSEIFTRLKAQFGDATLSQNRLYTWVREFRDGRERVESESHDRRPRTSLTNMNMAVRERIEGDRRLTIEQISSKLGSAMRVFNPSFEGNEEVEEYVRNWLTTRPQTFDEEGIFKLPNRWQKCVEHGGDYIEKC
ncbi:hypothetical protein NQ317_013327 [Molorchus minor]|uniref:Mos1 transposase HTH domain-containing protein n=1 Tax=Molorchus minor TaxID=1323400 RepID=A0ABQ9K1K1_9CUCU|nr:hypothetical protein NQ317_013327 [Molorchus minor]